MVTSPKGATANETVKYGDADLSYTVVYQVNAPAQQLDTVTKTVHYVDTEGNPLVADFTDHANFTELTDALTGAKSYGPASATLGYQDNPVISGYHIVANPAGATANETVKFGDADLTYTVVYEKDGSSNPPSTPGDGGTTPSTPEGNNTPSTPGDGGTTPSTPEGNNTPSTPGDGGTTPSTPEGNNTPSTPDDHISTGDNTPGRVKLPNTDVDTSTGTSTGTATPTPTAQTTGQIRHQLPATDAGNTIGMKTTAQPTTDVQGKTSRNKLPNTGDEHSNLLAMLGMSLVALFGGAISRRKRN
ncbi:LPXTG cell wall anchor domain-containing protein [Lacticaseibacillus sp. GG6-2]